LPRQCRGTGTSEEHGICPGISQMQWREKPSRRQKFAGFDLASEATASSSST